MRIFQKCLFRGTEKHRRAFLVHTEAQRKAERSKQEKRKPYIYIYFFFAVLPRSTEIAKNDKVRAYSFYVKKKKKRIFLYSKSSGKKCPARFVLVKRWKRRGRGKRHI